MSLDKIAETYRNRLTEESIGEGRSMRASFLQGWPVVVSLMIKSMRGIVPLVTHIALHICFWLIVHAFLLSYLYLGFMFLVSALEANVSIEAGHIFAYAIFLSLFNGLVLGIIDYFVDNLLFVTRSIGRVVALHVIISLFVFVVTFLILRTYTSARFLVESTFSEGTWRYLFYVLFVQYAFGSLLVAMSLQIFKKYGKRVFLPLLLGVYRQPREQRKIFMFLDLKGSTTVAEKLGHIAYSRMVQQIMIDVNRSLNSFGGDIYQYAGDEIIITWNLSRKNAKLCLVFFFALQKTIHKQQREYIRRYGMLPTFKAGIDCGVVTAVEIGDIKRDIAYHGDTVNTASRLQNLCNTIGKDVLISCSVRQLLSVDSNFGVQHMGCVQLKGKEKKIDIYAIEEGVSGHVSNVWKND